MPPPVRGRPAPRRAPAVVALGGGHGLSASLSALRHVTDQLTAVVTVADDGGSSGRLRDELGVLPPGDLRMALSALCDDGEWGRTWRDVLQHRFDSSGDLHGHAVGNLLIVALWQLLEDPVDGLDWVARLLDARGRVLPMAVVPLRIEADVAGLDPADANATRVVRGQVEVASTAGTVRAVRLEPADPPASAEAVDAVREADWVVLGPGSWFTCVTPHLLVPELADALVATAARRCVVMNLAAAREETAGLQPRGPRRGHWPSTRRTCASTSSWPIPSAWTTWTRSRALPPRWAAACCCARSVRGTGPPVTTRCDWLPRSATSSGVRGDVPR